MADAAMNPTANLEQVPISLVVITKNEERNIRDCLESVRWADEVVVIDAESSDRTVEIAKRYTEKLFVRPWVGFGSQKNFGIDQAANEWIMILDADERATSGVREEISRILRDGPAPEVAGFEIPRRNFFYGRWIRGGGLSPDYQVRLFRRSAGRYDDTRLHERLSLGGRILRLNSPLDHYSISSVGQHVAKMIGYTTLGAREKRNVGSRVTPLQVGGNHLVTIAKTYLVRGGYRDGVHGLIVALFAGMYTFVKYAKVWEMLSVKREG